MEKEERKKMRKGMVGEGKEGWKEEEDRPGRRDRRGEGRRDRDEWGKEGGRKG